MDKYLIRLPKPSSKATNENDKKNNNDNINNNIDNNTNNKDNNYNSILIEDSPKAERNGITSRKTKTPTPKGPTKAKKPARSSTGMTIEQHRRKMGDAVKSRLSMEKYCMKADCHATVDVPMDVFRNLVVPNAKSVVPEVFTGDTPVVVASIVGSLAAGEVFGKSKIKGGNRMEQREIEKVEFVYFPLRKKARIWWIMYGRYYEEDDDDDDDC